MRFQMKETQRAQRMNGSASKSERVDEFVEARVGFEPTNGGFADLSLRPLGYRAGVKKYNETGGLFVATASCRHFGGVDPLAPDIPACCEFGKPPAGRRRHNTLHGERG